MSAQGKRIHVISGHDAQEHLIEVNSAARTSIIEDHEHTGHSSARRTGLKPVGEDRPSIGSGWNGRGKLALLVGAVSIAKPDGNANDCTSGYIISPDSGHKLKAVTRLAGKTEIPVKQHPRPISTLARHADVANSACI